MNLHVKSLTTAEREGMAEELSDLAAVDTIYSDLYLQRAREILAPALNESEYAALKQMQSEALNLPNRIRNAMEQGNWRAVKDLSARLAGLKRTLAEKETLSQTGRKIYEPAGPFLDPFSPGLQGLPGVAPGGDEELRDRSRQRLERLEKADPGWRVFYADRRRALAELKLETPEELADEEGPLLQKEAREALDSGNFEKLEKLAGNLLEEEASEGKSETPGRAGRFARNALDLSCDFPEAVLARARKLGMAAMRMEPGSHLLNLAPEELTRLHCHIRHPTFTEQIRSGEGSGLKEKLSLPADTPAALLELIELFTLHPFINSRGARFLPFLGPEDLLVEDFDDPDPESAIPASPLLSALGLRERRGLSRSRLEKLLLERGSQIVGDLGLDPWAFRLICIPPDLYLRIGIERGWGRKPFWTHFDGYMVMQNGKLGALAGGDVRFGGLYDLLGLGRDYDSDRVMVRFAVVQRRRMEGCH